MKNIILISFSFLLLISFKNSASAQTKIGYFDEQSVISLIPGVREKRDTLITKYIQDTLQDEYNYTLKEYQVKDSIFKRDSVTLSKRPIALEMAINDLNKIKYKLINWQQYQEQTIQQKEQYFLSPYRKKVIDALNEVVIENKYSMVMKEEALYPYARPSIVDNLTIRVAIKLNLNLPKEILDAYKTAIDSGTLNKNLPSNKKG